MQKILLTFILLLSGLSGISYEILYGRILGDQFAESAAVPISARMTAHQIYCLRTPCTDRIKIQAV
jgi:hypothetical protein